MKITDKDRLDFLENNTLFTITECAGYFYVVDVLYFLENPDSWMKRAYGKGETKRKAIDNAIRVMREKEIEEIKN